MKTITTTRTKAALTNIVFLLLLLPFVTTASAPMLIRLGVDGNQMDNETVVYFDANGSLSYNPNNDAPSLGVDSGYVNVVTCFDNIDFQIKCLPALTQSFSIPVKVTTGTTGTYELYAYDFDNIPVGACLILIDNQNGNTADLRYGPYNCTIADTESVARFTLQVSITIVPISGNYANPHCRYSADGFVSIDAGTSAGSWNYYWMDTTGNVLKVTSQATAADTLFGLNAGAYRVNVSADGTCFSGSMDFVLQGTQASNALFTSNDTIDLVDVATFSNASANSASYWWEFGDGMGAATTAPYHYYTATGTYTVTLFAYGSACPDTSVFTKQLVVVQQTMSAAQNSAAQLNTVIEKDGNGYFVQFGSDKDYSALISVTDLLGRSLDYKEVKVQAGVKSYLSLPATAQGTLVSVKSATGAVLAKKLIVE